jgi:type II secretory pathway pseudopilin PulG
MKRGEQRGHQRGFTFAGVLVLLAICMLGLGIAGPLWSRQAKREREQELLRVGALYAHALASYHDGAPGSQKQYPARLDKLLLDARFVGVMRHLRKLYPDPMNPDQPWGLVLDGDNRIAGVYSRSDDAPLIDGPVNLDDFALPPAKHYSDWKFMLPAKP